MKVELEVEISPESYARAEEQLKKLHSIYEATPRLSDPFVLGLVSGLTLLAFVAGLVIGILL